MSAESRPGGLPAERIAFDAMAVAPTAGGPALGNEVIPFLAIDDARGSDGHSGARIDDSLLAGIRHAGPLAIAGLVANGANVIVTVLVARLLSARDYGALADLLSLFLVISMPGSALLVAVVRRITAWRGIGAPETLRAWTARIHHRGLVGLALLVTGAWLARHAIAGALRLPSSGGVVEVIAAGGVWLLLSVDRGVLQAHRSYVPLAGNLLVEGGVRTVLTVGLTAAGFGVGGAAGGILAAEVMAALHARFLTRTRVMGERDPLSGAKDGPAAGDLRGPAAGALRGPVAGTEDGPVAGGGRPVGCVRGLVRIRKPGPLVVDSAIALTSLALLAVLQNVDVIFVGRDDPAHSGAYAAISVASKALVFGALGLGSYLLPEAAIRWQRGGHALRQLWATAMILALPAAALLGAALVVPDLLLKIVFGQSLTYAAGAFATLAGAMICLSATVVMTNYLLGVGRRWIVAALAAGAGAAALLVSRAAGNVLATARADLAVQAALAAAVGVAFVRVHHRAARSGKIPV